jgi:hypothetical protein
MQLSSVGLLTAVPIGIGATLLMDLWNLFLKRAFQLPSLDYCLLGRWVRHFQEGTFRHASIAAAAPKQGECTVGWIAHYSIGIMLAVVFIIFASAEWLTQPTLLPPLAYGIVTVVFPFFVLQPALGLGIASAKAARPTQARLKSLGTHAMFGLGLYLATIGVMLLKGQ